MELDDLIEHRLYSFEQAREDRIVLTTPKRATWFALQGYRVFDFTESLEMEPEYYHLPKEVDFSRD